MSTLPRGEPASSLGRRAVVLMTAAAVILSLTMGVRQSLGLFVLPIVAATGVGLVSVSFALAIGQFVWGAAQPVLGAVADRFGAHRVLVLGGLMMAAGGLLGRLNTSVGGFTLSLGVLMAAGTAAGSFAILIGVTSRCVPAEKRSMVSGIINAGGSTGQFLFVPFTQFLIRTSGWGVGMLAISIAALFTLPLAWLFRRGSAEDAGDAHETKGAGDARESLEPSMTLREQLRVALKDRNYLYLHAGFFTCGFHIAFLVTHLPGNLQLCGLPATVAANSLSLIGVFNMIGSLTVGWLGNRYRMKNILSLLYASRAAVIVCYLLMPKTAFNMYLVAGALGFSWLATVPPTAGLVGKLFGTRYLTTLFGLTLLSHQIGGFLGAWLGGLAMARLGSYDWVWYADIVLALGAALINLPIEEAVPVRPVMRRAAA
jgi:predicted MFS family arabinose efflux permease